MNSKSLLKSYIDNSTLLNSVLSVTKEALINIPLEIRETTEGFSLFKCFMIDFLKRHLGMWKVIKQIVYVSQDAFIEAFNLVDKSFPEIPEQNEAKESGESESLIISQLPKKSLSTLFGKLAVNSIFECLKACFIITRVTNGKNITHKDAKFITDYVFSLFKQEVSGNFLVVKSISSLFFARAISVLSIKFPEPIQDEVISILKNIKNIDSQHATNLFILFSEIIIIPDSLATLDFESILEGLQRFSKRKCPSTECVEAMFKFLINFVGQLLDKLDNLTSSDFVYKLNIFVKGFRGKKKYIGLGHKLHALLYNFTTHKRMNYSLEEYYDKYISPLFENTRTAKCALEQCTIFLYGTNFASDREIDSGINFEWTVDPAKVKPRFVQNLIDTVKKHTMNFQDAQKELADFVIQVLVITKSWDDLLKFLLPEFSHPNCEAIALVVTKLIKFNGSTDFEKEELLRAVSFFVESSLEKITKDIKRSDSSITAFQWQNGFSLYKDSNMDVNTMIDTFIDSSHPIKYSTQPSKIISVQIKRWMKVLKVDPKKKIFTQVDSPLKFTTDDGEVDEGLLNVVAICAQLPFNESYLDLLLKTLFIGSPRNKIASIFAIEIIAIKHRAYSEVLTALFRIISKGEFISTLSFYILFKIVNQIVELSIYNGYTLSQCAIRDIDYIILLGICSDSYITRRITQKLCNLCESSGIQTIYSSISRKIEKINQNVLIRIQRAIDPTIPIDLPEITFNDVASSEYGIFWMFYIAQIGHTIKKTTTLEFKQGFNILFDALIRAGLNNACEKLLIKNATVFLANSITPEIITKQNSTHISLILHRFSRNNDEHSLLQHCALFSAFKFGSCTDVLTLNVKDPWALYSIAFATMLISSSPKFLQQEDETKYCIFLFDILNKVYEYLGNISLFTEDGLNEEMFVEMPDITGLLSNVLLTLKNICNIYIKNHSETMLGPFDRSVIIDNSLFDKEKWIKFAMMLVKSPVSTLAISTLSELLKICKLPADLIEKIKEINDVKSPLILTAVLARNIIELYDYVEESIGDHFMEYFQGITMLFNTFESSEAWVKRIKEKGSIDNSPEFSKEIFKQSGSLLALSFAFMSNNDLSKDMHIKAFTLFANVSLGALVMLNKVDAICQILNAINPFFATIRSRHTNLSSGAIRGMSGLVSRLLIHTGEQFVYTMFKCMVKWPKNSTLSYILDPWIKSVNVSPGSQVLKTTDPYFHSFTPISFIRMCASLPSNSGAYSIISKVISSQEPETQDILTVLLFVIIFDDCDPDNYGERVKKLHSIINTWPERCGAFLSHVFGFEGSIYMEEYRKLSDKKVSYDRINAEILDNLANVQNTTEEFNAIALNFILIHIEEYAGVAGPFLLSLVPSFIEREEYVSALGGAIGIFGHEALKWGCCSPSLHYALRGMSFYSQVLDPLNYDVVMAIARAVSQVAHTLSENTDVNYLTDALSYIEWALTTLLKAVRVLKEEKPLNELFILVMKLCSIKNEHGPTVSEKCIAILNEIVTHEPTMIKVQEELGEDFEGLIGMFGNIYFTASSIPDFVSLMIKLVKYPKIAAHNILQLILILMPLDELYPSEDRNFYIDIANQVDGEISKTIRKLASIKPIDARAQHVEIVENAVEVLTTEEIASVIQLFVSIKSHSQNIRFCPVYQLCISIVLSVKSPEGMKFDLIAREASIDGKQENILLKNAFLQTINTKGVCIAEADNNESYIPVIDSIHNECDKYDIDDPARFPPIVHYDGLVEKIPVEPFQSYESLIDQMDSSDTCSLATEICSQKYNGEKFLEEINSKFN